MLLGGQVAPQPLHAAAHDHQQIVEIVRDAAGQLPDGLQTLRLSQRGFRRLAPLRLVMEPPRTPQRNADDDQQQQGRGQAEDQMARHGREPFPANRRAVDAGDHVDRKALELAQADAALERIDLRVRDGEDHALRPLHYDLVERAAGLKRTLAIGQLRIAGEKTAVAADQRVEASRAAADQRVEFLEIARQHRHRDHAVERAIGRGATAGEHEEGRAEPGQARRQHLADMGAGLAGRMRAEKVAVARAEVGGHLRELAGHQRPAVAIDEKDRAQLRQRIDDALDAVVQVGLVGFDLLVRHPAHHLVDLGDGALHGLEDLERVLVQDIERALDAVVGDGIFMLVALPRRKAEQHGRKHHRCNHHQLQQPDRGLPGGAHWNHFTGKSRRRHP